MRNQGESKDGVPRKDTSDQQPDLVSPSGVNERDHGADAPSDPSNRKK